MKKINFFKIIEKELQMVENQLIREVSTANSLSSEVSKYIFKSGGKRLRPALLILTAKHYNYSGDAHIHIATAIEFIHTASLLHDDVVDEATIRRGTASVNSVWGNRISILVGDFLFAKASSILLNHLKHEIVSTITKTMLKMAEGELLQMSKNKNHATTEDDYIEIVDKKTADLISSACRIGAIIGGGTKSEIERFARFGRDFGIAFQIIDDTLDYTSTVHELGKAIGNDLKEGKLTLPLIYVLKVCKNNEREKIYKTISSDNPDMKFIFSLIAKYKAIEYAKDKARSYAQSALQELVSLPKSKARSTLEGLSKYVVERRF